MALSDVTNSFIRRLRLKEKPLSKAWTLQCQRYASTSVDPAVVEKERQDLDHSEFQSTTPETAEERIGEYRPAENARKRKAQLPPSRYFATDEYCISGHGMLTAMLDTNFALHDTIAVLCIPISRRKHPIQHLASLKQAHSHYRASNKHTMTLSPKIS